jgi:hypothetical protein
LKSDPEPRKPGRPRKHEDVAARVAAFRAKKAYPGHRHDVYLGEDAHAIVSRLKKTTGLSVSAILDGILTGEIKLPVTKR